MKRFILVLLTLFTAKILFSQEIEITPLIIKGADISPFPSFQLRLPRGFLREEKLKKEDLPKNYLLKFLPKSKLWKEKKGYLEIENTGGSFETYSGRILSIVKGKNNSLLFQQKRSNTHTFREEGRKNSIDNYLFFLFKQGAVSGRERKVNLNLLGPTGKGKVGERHIYSSFLGVKLNREKQKFSIGERPFNIKEKNNRYSGNNLNFEIKGENLSFNLREESLNKFYSSGEGELSFSSFNYPWGIKIVSDGKGISFLPQYTFSGKISKNLNLLLLIEGKRNPPSPLIYYENSGVKVREKFLPSEKRWEGKIGIEKNGPFSFTSFIFYQRNESILSWKKKDELWQPVIFPKAGFTGLGTKFHRKIGEKFLWEGEGIYRKEIHNVEIPYFPLSGIKTSLLRRFQKGEGKISIEYNGKRYFKRDSKRKLEDFTKMGLDLETRISSHVSLSFNFAQILGKEVESFKGYPIPSSEFYLSLKINW